MTLRTSALLLALGLSACASSPKPAPEAPASPEPQATAVTQPTPAPEAGPRTVPARPLIKPEPLHLVVQPNPDSPIVSFRLVFHSGSVDDPKGLEGLTSLTADVLTFGGTEKLSSAQVLEALFPMAAELQTFTDKEFTVFEGRVHKDFLGRFLDIFTDVLLAPRYDPREFERMRANALSTVKNNLRSADDETLGKVALESMLFEGHPYAHYAGGTVQGLQRITLGDVKAQSARVFTQDRLVVGLAGAVDENLQNTVLERLRKLPPTGAPAVELPPVTVKPGQALIVEKPALSTAISMGYATRLRRDAPDFFAVATALSYLGEHRQSSGVLFQELREKRGLNYGDYAYAEHFIQEQGTTYNRTNLAHTQQDISLWVRPVVPANAVFATRGAVYFLQKLVDEGIPQDKFELSRGFLGGYTRLWEQTDQRRLGFAIDNLFYGTSDFLEKYRAALKGMSPESVHAAVKRHLRPELLNFAFVTKDAQGLSEALKGGVASPIQYASQKAPELLEVDKAISTLHLPISPDEVKIVPASDVMEK